MTHESKNGTFVDARSQDINDKMNARFEEASQPTFEDGLPQTPTAEAIDNMYFDVVGGVKKKRLYGIGSQEYVTYPDAMSGHVRRAARLSSSTVIVVRVDALQANENQDPTIVDATARADAAIGGDIAATADQTALATAEVVATNERCMVLTKDNEALRQELDVLRQQVRILMRNVIVQLPSSP
ncbi:uncharacterized protein [Primulina eburnea]|uniref:uncharacterized protein n=1 Tax=Primulina eburnea TaxID=1245227 RepID=UPI003C6CB888